VDFFYNLSRRLEDLDGHRLLAYEALQVLNLLLKLPQPADRHHVFTGLYRSGAAAFVKLHPTPDNGRLDVELACDRGQRRLPAADPFNCCPFELGREHTTTVGFPREVPHAEPPFVALF